MFDPTKIEGITKQDLETLTGLKLDDTVEAIAPPSKPPSDPRSEPTPSATPDENEIAKYGGDTAELHD